MTPTTAEVWPVSLEGIRGWPMPDTASDPCGLRPDGWRPWAVWQSDPGWYIAFYTCDRRHAWTCGHAAIGRADDLPDLQSLRVSPFRIVPDDDHLRRAGVDPGALRLCLVEWPDR